MNSYLLVYIVMIFLFLLLSSFDFSYQVEVVLGKKGCRVKPVVAVAFVLPLVYFACNRDISFGDTYPYIRMFENMPDSFEGLLKYLEDYPKDPGYTVFMWIVKILGFNWQFLFFLVASIQISSLVYVYRKYSCNYFLSMLLFLIGTDYFSWMQNGIRQFIAVTIIFACTGWILEKKYVRTILVILFASLFHQSALLMIPVIFLVQGDALNIRMLAVFFLFLISVVFISAFTGLLDSALQDTQYSTMVSDFTEGTFSNDDGTNPLRVLVYSVPVVLAVVLRFRGVTSFLKIINLSINMSLLSVGFYLVSMFTSGIFIGRIPIYFSLYNYILIPWELKKLFVKRQYPLVVCLTICMYLVFSTYQFNINWSII